MRSDKPMSAGDSSAKDAKDASTKDANASGDINDAANMPKDDGIARTSEPIFTTEPGAADEPVARNDTSQLIKSKREPDDLQGMRLQVDEVAMRDVRVGNLLMEFLLHIAQLEGYDFAAEDERLAQVKIDQEQKMADQLKADELQHRAKQIATNAEDEQVREIARQQAEDQAKQLSQRTQDASKSDAKDQRKADASAAKDAKDQSKADASLSTQDASLNDTSAKDQGKSDANLSKSDTTAAEKAKGASNAN